MQLIWCLLSYFYLNTFRASLCPSSGEQECALPHTVFCAGCDGCGCVELGRELCALWKSNSNFIFNFMSFLMSSSHLFFGLPCGHVDIGFHLYTFFTILSSGIRCKWPNQLNPCAFMWFITFLCLINSSNSSFVLILYVQSLSFVGPKIFLNTFLSNTINLFFMVSFKTHTSQPYVSIDLIILTAQFQFCFLGDQFIS